MAFLVRRRSRGVATSEMFLSRKFAPWGWGPIDRALRLSLKEARQLCNRARGMARGVPAAGRPLFAVVDEAHPDAEVKPGRPPAPAKEGWCGALHPTLLVRCERGQAPHLEHCKFGPGGVVAYRWAAEEEVAGGQ